MSRRNLLLLVLLVLLVGIYILVDPASDEGEGPPAIRPFDFLSEPESAREVFVAGPSAGPFRLTREAYRWHLSEPIRAPADSAVVTQLLTLAESIVLEPIGISTADLEPYGLLPVERLEVRIASASGDASTFYLGRKIPLDVIHTYAHVPGEETLYRTLSDYREFLSREIEALLDTRVLPVEAAAPDRLIIETADDRIEVTRKEGGFFLGPGESHPADGSRVVEVTRKLAEARLRPSEGVTENVSMTEDPVSPGVARLTFGMDTGENIVVTLPVSTGGPDGEGPEGSVSSSLWPGHMLVVEETLRLPELSRQAFLDRRLLPITPEEIRRIGIEHAEGGVFLRREGSGWSVFPVDPGSDSGGGIQSTGMPGNPAVVEAALRSLGALRGVRFVSQAPESRGDPVVTLEAVTLDGEVHLVGVFAGDDGSYFAQTTRYRRVLEVTPDLFETLLVEPGVFVDTSLVSFDLPAVFRIHIRTSGRELLIAREAGGDWSLRRPDRRLLETAQVVAFLFSLRDLEHTGQSAGAREASGDETAHGTPRREVEQSLRVTLEGAGGETISWFTLRGDIAESDRLEGSYKVSSVAVAPLYDFVAGLEADSSAGR
jgi:hypothetical protein